MPLTPERFPAERGARLRRSAGRREEPFLRGVVGASPRMQRIFRLVAKVAGTVITVLLLGESGTGKELIARSIHLQSRRAEAPFVAVNMAAIPESLLESELFGARRGAFTGAETDRRGLVEEADGGTLFLDEVGDMPLATQVKLLRTLENGEVRRLGDHTSSVVNVRVIAATHHDLIADVAAGRFRQDLYYRLNVVQIELPPLRERKEDIGLLASYFLERFTTRAGRSGLHFTPEAMARLEGYDYPGNVRELENAIEHAVALADGSAIGPGDLPAVFGSARQLEAHAPARAGEPAAARPAAAPAQVAAAPSPAQAGDPRESWSLADVEKEHIQRVLARHRGNATSAAKQLGISRTTLWRKLRQYGLSRKGA